MWPVGMQHPLCLSENTFASSLQWAHLSEFGMFCVYPSHRTVLHLPPHEIVNVFTDSNIYSLKQSPVWGGLCDSGCQSSADFTAYSLKQSSMRGVQHDLGSL